MAAADWRGSSARFSNGVEHDEDRAGIRRIGEGRAGESDDVHGVGDARHLQRDVDGAAVDLVGARQRRRRRQLRDDDEIAAVELRDEAHRRPAEFVEAEGNDAGIDHQHQHRDAHHAARQPAIAARQRVEAPIEDAERSRGSGRPTSGPAVASACGLSSKRAQRRRQRQRHDQRNDGRAGDGQRELTIELPGNAGDERGRHEHRAQHQRDRDQRGADLVHALDRRFARLQARLRYCARRSPRRRWRRRPRCRSRAPARTATGC